jgi:hypothetical protein
MFVYHVCFMFLIPNGRRTSKCMSLRVSTYINTYMHICMPCITTASQTTSAAVFRTCKHVLVHSVACEFELQQQPGQLKRHTQMSHASRNTHKHHIFYSTISAVTASSNSKNFIFSPTNQQTKKHDTHKYTHRSTTSAKVAPAPKSSTPPPPPPAATSNCTVTTASVEIGAGRNLLCSTVDDQDREYGCYCIVTCAGKTVRTGPVSKAHSASDSEPDEFLAFEGVDNNAEIAIWVSFIFLSCFLCASVYEFCEENACMC